MALLPVINMLKQAAFISTEQTIKVPHTRQSLAYLQERANWQVQNITAAKPYPVWNHLLWCLHNKTTFFKASSNDARGMALNKAYEHYLTQRDQTDYHIAVAKLECK